MHFGVREHAMGAIVNGMTLSKLRAFGSSFLVFSDYMPAGNSPRGADEGTGVSCVHERFDRRR